MGKYGVNRRVVSREELLNIEPALRQIGDQIVGGTFTASDESGDARVFTQELVKRCQARGAQFLWKHDVLQLDEQGGAVQSVQVRDRDTGIARSTATPTTM